MAPQHHGTSTSRRLNITAPEHHCTSVSDSSAERYRPSTLQYSVDRGSAKVSEKSTGRGGAQAQPQRARCGHSIQARRNAGSRQCRQPRVDQACGNRPVLLACWRGAGRFLGHSPELAVQVHLFCATGRDMQFIVLALQFKLFAERAP